jgi:Putative porin
LKRIAAHKIFFSLLFCLVVFSARAQRDIFRGIGNRVGNIGGQQGSSGNDSVKARNKFEDSLTLTIYYFDSAKGYKLDSSINDFTRRYPIPATHIYLGNNGAPTRSILFAPQLKAGWDPGFHALDVYKFSLEKVRFFNTTRPYTELGYILGARAEQIIEVLHTQNIRPNWNFSFNYRLINSPGVFRNQRTNHNNYLFSSWYQGRKKRYTNYFVLLGNRLQAGESGGLVTDNDLDNVTYAKDRSLIPTNIGGDPTYGTDFFSTALTTGNRYREFNFLMRQQYDFGKKDSIITDSTVIPLFYPRLRFEHTFKYGSYKYSFQDIEASNRNTNNTPDTLWYINNYGIRFYPNDSIFLNDNWKEISNDFSIYQFPDAKNLHQFIKLGTELQILNGTFRDTQYLRSASLYNVIAHGEYRNLTRNKKWDMLAFGRLWMAGYNIGDYHAYVSLQRLLSSKFGSFQLGFENVNRSPWFTWDPRSAFYWDPAQSFNNENTTHLFASIFLQKLKLQLSGDYYLVGNYLYLADYHIRKQENSIFNVLRINALKTFKMGRHWNWYAEVYVQQKAGNANVNIPLLYTRNRLMYEGNLGFKNLNIAFGLEGRYHTPYKADNYSPVLGQFFYQDSVTISNLPDIHAFLHFRIRGFRAYIRAENLNTVRLFGGFQFNNNNLAAPGYPTPGLNLRFGVYWSFVN